MINRKDYTESQWQLARHYAAQSDLRCAGECMEVGYFAEHVTPEDAAKYQQKRIDSAVEIIAGQHDNNFTVRQRMCVYLTGECPAFLAN